jgi:MFS family permease
MMQRMETTVAADARIRRQDVRTISLVGVAHGTSHFSHLLLPPLFPWFIQEFGSSYAELGLLVSVFFVVSGVGQALAGFLVDRIGARPVMHVALGCFAAAALATSAAQGMGGLMLAAVLAGLGNAPFHPVDFTILNRRVSSARLGHAFSVHGLSGNIGWALAPLFLAGIAGATGSWRLAAASAALVALGVLALTLLQRADLADRADAVRGSKETGTVGGVPAGEHALAFLRLPSVWLCFLFFFWTSAALGAVQSFAGPALQALQGIPATTASLVVSGFMGCGALGMVLGGFLAPRAQRLERVISAALVWAGAMLLLAGSGWLGPLGSLLAASVAGFGTGLAGPSRDLLIKRAAPPGATGRVYGTVYSGLDLGFAVAAPVWGWLMDHGQPAGVFHGAGAALVLAVVSATLVGARVARTRPATAA